MKLKRMVVAAVSSVALTVGGIGVAQALPTGEAFCGPAGDQCSIVLQGAGSPTNPRKMGDEITVAYDGVVGESVDLQLFRVVLGKSETGKTKDAPVLSAHPTGEPKKVTATGKYDDDQVKFATSTDWFGGQYVVTHKGWDGKALSGLIPMGKGSDSVSMGYLTSPKPFIKGLPAGPGEYAATATHDLTLIAQDKAGDFDSVYVDFGTPGMKLAAEVLIDGEWVNRTSLKAPPFGGEPNVVGDMGVGYVTFDLPETEGTFKVRVINLDAKLVLDYKDLSVTMINAPKGDTPSPAPTTPAPAPTTPAPTPTAEPTAKPTVKPTVKPTPVKPGKPGLPKTGH